MFYPPQFATCLEIEPDLCDAFVGLLPSQFDPPEAVGSQWFTCNKIFILTSVNTAVL